MARAANADPRHAQVVLCLSAGWVDPSDARPPRAVGRREILVGDQGVLAFDACPICVVLRRDGREVTEASLARDPTVRTECTSRQMGDPKADVDRVRVGCRY